MFKRRPTQQIHHATSFESPIGLTQPVKSTYVQAHPQTTASHGQWLSISSIYSQEDTASTVDDYITSTPQPLNDTACKPAYDWNLLVTPPDSASSRLVGNETETGKKPSIASYIPNLRRTRSTMTKGQNGSPKDYPSAIGSAPMSRYHSAYKADFDSRDDRYQVNITAGNAQQPRKATWGERAAKMGRDALALDTRPSWKGGAGRITLVTPVKETTGSGNPSQYSAVKNVYRDGLPVDSDSDNSLGIVRSNSSEANDNVPNVQNMWNDAIEDKVSPIAPHDANRDYGDSEVSPVSTYAHRNYSKGSSQPSIMIVPQRNSSSTTVFRRPVGAPVAGKENRTPYGSEPSQPQSHFSWTTYADSAADVASIKTVRTAHQAQSQRQFADATSRFSWTTVNTTTTYQQDSPPPSPPFVPVPHFDPKAWRTPQDGGSMQRKPPTPPPHVPALSPGIKSLPQPPQVSKAMTHVDHLNAQRDGLATQRQNVARVITQLQKIDSASPMDVDWKTRKANKKRLEEYQARLEEVEREDHEIGLALTRARRRAEREEGVDSGLWVRRVTG